MVSTEPLVTSVRTAFPTAVDNRALWDGYLAGLCGSRRGAELAYFSTGIHTRHVVVNPLEEDVSGWSTKARMDRYAVEAMPLGKEAIAEALAASGLGADAVGCFVVVSCTGYATPGIDTRLARDLGMRPDTKRIVIGHVGCHAALPGLDVARQYVLAQGRPALLLCLELSSLHLQPSITSLDDVVVHALFSDGASAAVVEPAAGDRTGYAVIDVVSLTDVGTEEYMTWKVTDHGFAMTLSRQVPERLRAAVGPAVDDLLRRHGLGREDVGGWAVHPGGPRILDVVADGLALDRTTFDLSRSVLASHGNCSSATVLAVLEALGHDGGSSASPYVVVLAFGPGLTLAAALLRRHVAR